MGRSAICRRRPSRLPLLLAASAAVAAGQPTAERRLSWGTFTAESSNPTSAPAVIQEVPETDLSDKSTDVVAGIVETFLHKAQLQPGELDCLKDGAGDLAGEVMSVSENAMTLLQQVLGGKNGIADDDDGSGSQTAAHHPHVNDGAGSISAMVDSMQADPDGSASPPSAPQSAAPPPPPPAPTPSPQQQQAHKEASKSLAMFYGSRRLQLAAMAMSAPMLLMNLGYSVHHIADTTKDVVKKCVKGDAKRAFQIAGRHMRSIRYMEGHLVANGADVVTELADALQDYEAHNFKGFGHNMGRVLRKVLLSKNSNGLPEGLPGKMVVANVTAGLLRGFFGEGFALNLQTRPGYDPLHIDLHDCVGKNLAFFQSLWASTMLFYGKREARGPQTVSSEEKPSFGTAVAMTMLQLPTALRKCNIGEEEEHMLMDSIKRMGSGLKYDVDLPDIHQVGEDKIANDMATTVKDFARSEHYTFGEHLGRLLQELFVDVYGQKWSVDSTGTLRKRLVNMAAAEQRPLAGASARGLLSAPLVKVGALAAVPLFAGLVVLRLRHSSSHRSRSPQEDSSSDDAEAPRYSSEGVE